MLTGRIAEGCPQEGLRVLGLGVIVAFRRTYCPITKGEAALYITVKGREKSPWVRMGVRSGPPSAINASSQRRISGAQWTATTPLFSSLSPVIGGSKPRFFPEGLRKMARIGIADLAGNSDHAFLRLAQQTSCGVDPQLGLASRRRDARGALAEIWGTISRSEFCRHMTGFPSTPKRHRIHVLAFAHHEFAVLNNPPHES